MTRYPVHSTYSETYHLWEEDDSNQARHLYSWAWQSSRESSGNQGTQWIWLIGKIELISVTRRSIILSARNSSAFCRESSLKVATWETLSQTRMRSKVWNTKGLSCLNIDFFPLVSLWYWYWYDVEIDIFDIQLDPRATNRICLRRGVKNCNVTIVKCAIKSERSWKSNTKCCISQTNLTQSITQSRMTLVSMSFSIQICSNNYTAASFIKHSEKRSTLLYRKADN